jgi:hypothetical protein
LSAALLDLHKAWAWVVVVGNGLAGLWALGADRMPALRHPTLWWFTAFVEVALFLQVGLGVWLVAGEGIEAPQFHMFYGFVALIAVAILYSYKAQLRHRLHVLYGLGGLFLMGLGIRAMVLG